MIRQTVLASGALLATHGSQSSSSPARSFSSRKQANGAKSGVPSTAEEWVASLEHNQEAIRSAITEIRSIKSGSCLTKGWTKVTMTTPIEKLRLHAPANVIEMLKATHYYVSSSDAIVIGSDGYREQGKKRDDCFKKFHDVLIKAGEDAVKRERSKGPPKALAKEPPNKLKKGEYHRRLVDKKTMVRKEKCAERLKTKMAQMNLEKEKHRASASQGKQ